MREKIEESFSLLSPLFAQLRYCAAAFNMLFLLHYYYLPLLLLLLLLLLLVFFEVFAMAPTFADEALFLAATMVLLSRSPAFLEFLDAEVVLTLTTAFFFDVVLFAGEAS